MDMRTVLQILCIIFVACGISIEAVYKAHIGFALITAGSFLFAVSVKLSGREKK